MSVFGLPVGDALLRVRSSHRGFAPNSSERELLSEHPPIRNRTVCFLATLSKNFLVRRKELFVRYTGAWKILDFQIKTFSHRIAIVELVPIALSLPSSCNRLFAIIETLCHHQNALRHRTNKRRPSVCEFTLRVHPVQCIT